MQEGDDAGPGVSAGAGEQSGDTRLVHLCDGGAAGQQVPLKLGSDRPAVGLGGQPAGNWRTGGDRLAADPVGVDGVAAALSRGSRGPVIAGYLLVAAAGLMVDERALPSW